MANVSSVVNFPYVLHSTMAWHFGALQHSVVALAL
jgi:hypothetical protein